MADFAKLTAISILGMILAVTVRRQSPELAILTSLAAGICILTASLRYVDTVMRFWEDLARSAGMDGRLSGVLMKSVAVALLTQLGAQICRDGGEGALASKLELAGSGACIVLVLPMLAQVLETVAELL